MAYPPPKTPADSHARFVRLVNPAVVFTPERRTDVAEIWIAGGEILAIFHRGQSSLHGEGDHPDDKGVGDGADADADVSEKPPTADDAIPASVADSGELGGPSAIGASDFSHLHRSANRRELVATGPWLGGLSAKVAGSAPFVYGDDADTPIADPVADDFDAGGPAAASGAASVPSVDTHLATAGTSDAAFAARSGMMSPTQSRGRAPSNDSGSDGHGMGLRRVEPVIVTTVADALATSANVLTSPMHAGGPTPPRSGASTPADPRSGASSAAPAPHGETPPAARRARRKDGAAAARDAVKAARAAVTAAAESPALSGADREAAARTMRSEAARVLGCTATIDLTGLIVAPGFVDMHSHVTGGGGEAGPQSRVQEATLDEIVAGGVTTLVGVLGTDGWSRSLPNLLTKVRALAVGGITSYMWSGNYAVPPPTLTGCVRDDILVVPEVLGAGEIAVSDSRGTQPSVAGLADVASQCRVAGLLAGKAGVMYCHMGSGARGLEPLWNVLKTTEVPISSIIPTHVSRTPSLWDDSVHWVRAGGRVDLCGKVPDMARAALYFRCVANGDYETAETIAAACSVDRGVKAAALAASEPKRKPSPALGVGAGLLRSRQRTPLFASEYDADTAICEFSLANVSVSSDSFGSFPVFDRAGKVIAYDYGRPSVLLEAFSALVAIGYTEEEALRLFTLNPATALGLAPRKGTIGVGCDADLLVFEEDPWVAAAPEHGAPGTGHDAGFHVFGGGGPGGKNRWRLKLVFARGKLMLSAGGTAAPAAPVAPAPPAPTAAGAGK